jgi:hypothetical protein
MKRACVLLLTLCLCGCSAVYSTGPFGEKPWNIEGEIAEWEGTWIYPDGALTVAVTDGSSGLLKVAWVEKKGGNDLGKLISPQFDLITGETNRVLFKWDEPIVFFKMSK